MQSPVRCHGRPQNFLSSSPPCQVQTRWRSTAATDEPRLLRPQNRPESDETDAMDLKAAAANLALDSNLLVEDLRNIRSRKGAQRLRSDITSGRDAQR